jgi:hypothetical protein
VQIVQGRYVPAIEIISSGTPGRPTSRQLYVAEFRRRCEAGHAELELSREAKHLEGWLRSEHPGAPGCTCRSIENSIRDEYKTWRKGLGPTLNGPKPAP